VSVLVLLDPVFEALPDAFPTLQWHGDTFDLPAGEVLEYAAALERTVGDDDRAGEMLELGRTLFERWLDRVAQPSERLTRVEV